MSVRVIELAEATQPLAEYAVKAGDGPVVVTRDGDIVAIVMTLENADLETISLSANPAFMDLIERSRARQRREGGLSSAEMRRLMAAG